MKRDAFESLSYSKHGNHYNADEHHDFMCAAEIIKGNSVGNVF